LGEGRKHKERRDAASFFSLTVPNLFPKRNGTQPRRGERERERERGKPKHEAAAGQAAAGASADV
jgi:hypothetical protein